jgi:hypothetical protein
MEGHCCRKGRGAGGGGGVGGDGELVKWQTGLQEEPESEMGWDRRGMSMDGGSGPARHIAAVSMLEVTVGATASGPDTACDEGCACQAEPMLHGHGGAPQ